MNSEKLRTIQDNTVNLYKSDYDSNYNTYYYELKKEAIKKTRDEERWEILNEAIEFICSTTGCGKLQAQIVLEDNCMDVMETIRKISESKSS